MATTSPDRILSLDVIRGIAVMGIFSVNVVGMAMLEEAYFYPPAYGFGSLGDKIMWAANFILVDGKLRSLFSILFGASMVLVIERGVAAGKQGWQVHYPRMIVLLAFGLLHFYILWWGDILANYALVGMIAFAFWRLSAKLLLVLSVLALGYMYIPDLNEGMTEVAKFEAMAGPEATPKEREILQDELAELKAAPEDVAASKAEHASIPAHVEATLEHQAMRPFNSLFGYGLETLGLMLLGMAGYKSAFLTGAWSRQRYLAIAVMLVGGSIAAHSYAAWLILADDFSPFTFFPWGRILLAWLHPFAAVGYAALIILTLRRGWFADRVAAVGRTAFTNYLGATLIGTVLFYEFGLGLFGEVSRGEAWLFAPGVWLLMLLWSKPWLERFRYGPFEWAWRSLSRWRWEPMRRVPEQRAPALA